LNERGQKIYPQHLKLEAFIPFSPDVMDLFFLGGFHEESI
jgi:hypothetical protein